LEEILGEEITSEDLLEGRHEFHGLARIEDRIEDDDENKDEWQCCYRVLAAFWMVCRLPVGDTAGCQPALLSGWQARSYDRGYGFWGGRWSDSQRYADGYFISPHRGLSPPKLGLPSGEKDSHFPSACFLGDRWPG
jgi:hypothetical protein